jgi:NAD(P)-dependent dehydrogenase (short-subunit alcohol dehydrogenase family)
MKKYIIITGGYSGIGLELARMLLEEGHMLGLIIRNSDRKSEFLHSSPEFESKNIFFYTADLSEQNQVIHVARQIKDEWDKVDILFNNAGVLLGEKKTSAQENEMHYEVNTLAPYLLTTELKSVLKKSDYPLVVNTATGGLQYMKSINIDELIKPSSFRKLFGAYMQSKLALTLLMNHLSHLWLNDHIRIINISPGGNKTKMTSGDGMPWWMRIITALMYKKPQYGAKLLYDAAFKKEFSSDTGVYIENNKIEKLKISLMDKQREMILKGLKVI